MSGVHVGTWVRTTSTRSTAPPASSTFILVNDHDPKPLSYQLAAENSGELTWEYLDEGPDVWRVRIGRTRPA